MAERRLKELLKDSTGEDWEQAECPPALGWLDQPWGVRVTEHRAVCHGGSWESFVYTAEWPPHNSVK